MPHPCTKTTHAGGPTIAPALPTQVHCDPREALSTGHPDAAGANRATCDALAQQASHPPHPKGRSLEEVMRAFREQVRLTQEEGTPGAVIRQILAKSGPGSLTADLTQPH